MKSAWGVDRVWPLYLITGQKKNISVYPCSYQRLSAAKSGKKRERREKGQKGKARGGGSDSFAVGGGDVSPNFTIFPATSVARGGGSDSFAVGGGDVSPFV
ncbi:hypothetical protein [Syntrophorhabdus aromaticivorans]|uniref:hypothetical protein n=1 Tax=Syntrophorhabdus aromaticivorans TaxID=328301 RepID=UPI00040C2F67|nr:hypothetical protein [Syntrophorhabdus aromaticivorans]